MLHEYRTLRTVAHWLLLVALALWLSACATTPVALPTHAETLPEAITVPYRISTQGLLVVDISVNGHPAQPFIVDTGANVSTIYEKDARALGLTQNGQSVLVKGLVAMGMRPIVKDIEFQIGSRTFQLGHIVVLETSVISDEAIGLLGADLLADYTVVFNNEIMTATFVPSKYIEPRTFVGWRPIPLRHRVGSYPDNGLHFAQIILDKKRVPVLIDTGSNLSMINWHLATLDEDMRRLQRTLREQEQVQGAIGSTRLRLRTLFHDLVLGRHYWPYVTVTVMEFDTLSTVLPVDQPMMIAGADMFTSWTVAFDFGGNMIYIRANPDDPRPPSRRVLIKQAQFVPQSISGDSN